MVDDTASAFTLYCAAVIATDIVALDVVDTGVWVFAIVIDPEAFVIETPTPAVNVVRVKFVPLPISIWPFVGVDVSPVPPLATGNAVPE